MSSDAVDPGVVALVTLTDRLRYPRGGDLPAENCPPAEDFTLSLVDGAPVFWRIRAFRCGRRERREGIAG